MKHNGIDIQYLPTNDLLELFALWDELGQHEKAAQVLQEIQKRDAPPAVTHDVPKGLEKLIPSFLWHQKPVGEGSDTRMVRPVNYIKPR